MKAHRIQIPPRAPWLLAAAFLGGTLLQAETFFPLATSPQSVEFATGLASDGTGHLLLVLVDGKVNALPLHADGSPASEALELGSSPDFPPASSAAFAAPHYLAAWTDTAGPALGQLLSTTGEPQGDPFVIAPGSPSAPAYLRGLASDGTRFLAVLQDATPEGRGSLRGQVLNPDGTKSGGLFLIGDAQGGEIWTSTAEFGGGSFLVAWQRDDPLLHGQGQDLVTEAVLVSCRVEGEADVGGRVTLSAQPSSDRNPVIAAYDGQRFLVVWNYSGPSGPDSGGPVPELQLNGRFMNAQSEVEGPEMTLVADERSTMPALAFDGNDYLLCWHNGTDNTLWRQFLSRDGTTRSDRHRITGLPPAEGAQIAFPGVVFEDHRYFLVLNLLGVDFDADGRMVGLNSGDVYGQFLAPLPPSPGSPAQLQLLSVSRTDGTQLRVTGTPGVAYRVEAAPDVTGAWSDAGGGVPGPDGTFLFDSPTPSADRWFYRAVIP